jgi:hypothetical protein
MQNLAQNKYQKLEDFDYDMDKMFEDSLLYNFNNQKMTEFIEKIKEDWGITRLKVLQLNNLGYRQFINPPPEMLP